MKNSNEKEEKVNVVENSNEKEEPTFNTETIKSMINMENINDLDEKYGVMDLCKYITMLGYKQNISIMMSVLEDISKHNNLKPEIKKQIDEELSLFDSDIYFVNRMLNNYLNYINEKSTVIKTDTDEN